MIDFRYHVVSIIAVFLALSVGLVLGSSFLADIVKEDLDGQIQEQSRAAEAARRDLRTEEGENRQLNGFINLAKPELVADRLTKKNVVLIALPDANSGVLDATAKTMEESGATVTGTVVIKDAWTDPAKELQLSAAAGGDVALEQSGYDRAATVLTAAIAHKSDTASSKTPTSSATPGAPGSPASPGALTEAPPQPGASPGPPVAPVTGPDPAATGVAPTAGAPSAGPTGNGDNSDASSAEALAVLNRLKTAGFIDIKGNPETGATLAVVIAPSGPVKTADPAHANSVYLSLSRTLDSAADGTVVAGDTASAQGGGTVAALRGDERTAKVVSSVDAAETAPGQVSVDWALVVESAEGKSGQYGATGQNGWLPQLPVTKTENTETEKTS